MSIYPLIRVWDHSQQRGTPLLLLLAIADRADELGVCWAGTAWLAGRARLERRQTIRTIQQLESAKELLVIRSRGANGNNTVNHYIVAVGAGDETIDVAYQRIKELLSLRGSVIQDPSVIHDTRGSGGDDTRGSGGDDTRLVAGMSPDPSSYPEDKNDILNVPALWISALDELEMQMTRATFNQWLRGTTARSADDAPPTPDGPRTIIIQARNAYAIDWLSGRLSNLITDTLESIAGRPITIRFEVPHNEPISKEAPAPQD